MENDLENQTVLALESHWEIASESPLKSKEDVLAVLRVRILDWLENDFERLVNAMYKLDIAEEKFRAAMELQTPARIAPAIAELVWDREMKRAWFRKKYS